MSILLITIHCYLEGVVMSILDFNPFVSNKKEWKKVMQDIFRSFWQNEHKAVSGNVRVESDNNIVSILKDHGIRSLWHFTDSSNIESIEKYGLLTLRDIEQKNLTSKSGSDEYSQNVDRSRGLDKYVHLALINEHPMCYVATKRGSITYPVWIELDISIVEREGTLCSARNANRYPIYPIKHIENVADLERLMMPIKDLSVINARKAEILIEGSIPAHYIKEIHNGKKTNIFGWR